MTAHLGPPLRQREVRGRNIRPAIRKCLGCGKPFKSQGPHNRRCGRCGQGLRRSDQTAIVALFG